MPKITAGETKGLLIKYVIKIAVSTVLSIVVLNMLCSFIILKLDLDLSILQYAGTGICIASSIIVAFVSTSGFKNNFLMLSIISVMPLLVYTVVNFCVNKTGTVFIIIRVCAILVCAFAVSLIKSSKKSR